MKHPNESTLTSIVRLVELIERVVSKKRLGVEFHRDEVEKYFMSLLQGKDQLNPYARRDAGVSDEEWLQAIKECLEALKLNPIDTRSIF